MSWPFGGLFMDDMADKVEYAQLLNDGSEILTEKYNPQPDVFMPDAGKHGKAKPNTLLLKLPVRKPEVTVPVIELFLR